MEFLVNMRNGIPADLDPKLHAALASLPLWRYQDIEVIPLAGNGNDPGSDDQTRQELKRLYPLGG